MRPSRRGDAQAAARDAACAHCGRGRRATRDSAEENPHCSECLAERIQLSIRGLRPLQLRRFGKYVVVTRPEP